MAGLIVAADLKVASIFTKAHREHSLINYTLLFHHVVDGLESVDVRARSLCTQTHDAICILRVKVLSLSLHAAECILEHINAGARILSKVECVFGKEAFIAATFSITLIEPASVLHSARAVNV